MKKLFGKRLREIRRRKNLTQEQLAEMINIKTENYSRIENGLSFPKPENIEKLANILNVEISELFRFNNNLSYDEIFEKIVNKMKSDKEVTIMVYRYLESFGKI